MAGGATGIRQAEQLKSKTETTGSRRRSDRKQNQEQLEAAGDPTEAVQNRSGAHLGPELAQPSAFASALPLLLAKTAQSM